MNTEALINSYLRFGYIPFNVVPSWLDTCVNKETEGNFYNINEVIAKLDIIFDDLLSKYQSKNHIVLLSGGWDSRVILGSLLERVERASIETVTYGIPGQMDYEIPKKIAAWANIEHHSINLNEVHFTWEKVLDEVRKSPWTYVPDCYFNKIARTHLSSNEGSIVWSGFLGDPLFGNHVTKYEKDTEIDLKKYLESQIRVNNLTNKDFKEENYLYLIDNLSRFNIGYLDLLDLGIRQYNCIYSIISPFQKWNGWNACLGDEQNGNKVIAPFISPEWAGFWLQCPTKLRINCTLFLESMKQKFPELFSLPSKAYLGYRSDEKIKYNIRRLQYSIRRRLQKKFPKLSVNPNSTNNYLNYDEAFRTREDYQITLHSAFTYLLEVNAVPWIDLEKLKREHLDSDKSHGVAFQILIGLAANLKENVIK